MIFVINNDILVGGLKIHLPPILDGILRLLESDGSVTKILVRTFWHQAAPSSRLRRPGAAILPPRPPYAAELRNGPIFMKLAIFIQCDELAEHAI